MKKLLCIFSVLTLSPTGALAQDALCFIEWRENIIDLSSSICRNKTENNVSGAKIESLLASDIRLADVQIEETADGTLLEIRGNITNESGKASSLSLVNFNVINQQNDRVLTTDTIVIEARAGIEPGEQIAFSKLINKNIVGGNVKISDLRIEITGSV